MTTTPSPDHQPGARPEGRIHRSLASAEALQDRAEAEARYGKPPPQWLDTVANVGGVAVGAVTLAAAMQGYDRYMAYIAGRNARGGAR